jgi:hypothetical protein
MAETPWQMTRPPRLRFAMLSAPRLHNIIMQENIREKTKNSLQRSRELCGGNKTTRTRTYKHKKKNHSMRDFRPRNSRQLAMPTCRCMHPFQLAFASLAKACVLMAKHTRTCLGLGCVLCQHEVIKWSMLSLESLIKASF